MLYLIPKSSVGPPGLWLADRMIPPKAPFLRMTWLAAGVESSPRGPPAPGRSRWRGHLQRDLDDLAVEVPPVAADHQRLALEPVQAVEDRLDEVLDVVRLAKWGTFLRRPEVPGFWSA
jgi:hypothetical protein